MSLIPSGGPNYSVTISLSLVFLLLFLFIAEFSIIGIIISIPLEAINIVTNTVLTIALIIIYVRMSRSQRKQAREATRQADLQEMVTKTQQDQAELMEKQHSLRTSAERPILQVDRYRPAEPDTSRYSTSALEIVVSNIGRTPARELEVEFITGFPSDLPFQSGKSTISLRKKSEKEGWFHEWGENLAADTHEITYIGEPLMLVWYDEENNKARQKALEFMSLSGNAFRDVDNIRIKAILRYKGLNDVYEEPIFDYIVSLEPYGGMRTALERGHQYNSTMRYEISDIPHEHEW